jgi:hypothetical protein
MMRRRLSAIALALALAGCTPPIRQFNLKNQSLTCEQANDYAYRTLQSMGFTMTRFEPATGAHAGTLRGTREERGTQNVTVGIACNGTSANVDASEDGKLLGQLEFKRGFYLAFTAIAAQTAISTSIARQQAQRPIEQKTGQGLHVLVEPVRGLGAKLDFNLDLAAAGVLPVRVSINNVTPRTYTLDPDDIVLAQKDGTRVHPLTVADAVQRVAGAASQKPANDASAAPDSAEVTRRFQSKLLTARSIAAGQTLQGYLFFPLADYVKGRVTLEDQASEEAEGFVVEF